MLALRGKCLETGPAQQYARGYGLLTDTAWKFASNDPVQKKPCHPTGRARSMKIMGSAEKKGTEELIRAHYEELERIGELETPVYVAKNAIDPVTFVLYVSEASRSGSLWFGHECSRDGPGSLDHWTRRSEDMGDLGAARTIVSMIRCAFAHDPFNPRWECRGARVAVLLSEAVGIAGLHGGRRRPIDRENLTAPSRLASGCEGECHPPTTPPVRGQGEESNQYYLRLRP